MNEVEETAEVCLQKNRVTDGPLTVNVTAGEKDVPDAASGRNDFCSINILSVPAEIEAITAEANFRGTIHCHKTPYYSPWFLAKI